MGVYEANKMVFASFIVFFFLWLERRGQGRTERAQEALACSTWLRGKRLGGEEPPG